MSAFPLRLTGEKSRNNQPSAARRRTKPRTLRSEPRVEGCSALDEVPIQDRLRDSVAVGASYALWTIDLQFKGPRSLSISKQRVEVVPHHQSGLTPEGRELTAPIHDRVGSNYTEPPSARDNRCFAPEHSGLKGMLILHFEVTRPSSLAGCRPMFDKNAENLRSFFERVGRKCKWLRRCRRDLPRSSLATDVNRFP
jgi:hypothetical protein